MTVGELLEALSCETATKLPGDAQVMVSGDWGVSERAMMAVTLPEQNEYRLPARFQILAFSQTAPMMLGLDRFKSDYIEGGVRLHTLRQLMAAADPNLPVFVNDEFGRAHVARRMTHVTLGEDADAMTFVRVFVNEAQYEIDFDETGARLPTAQLSMPFYFDESADAEHDERQEATAALCDQLGVPYAPPQHISGT